MAKLKERIGIERIAWAVDRGMLTSARIKQVRGPQGLEWVSSLRAQPAAQRAGRRLARGPRRRALPHGQASGADDLGHLLWTRRDGAIAAEVLLDGLYVIRPGMPTDKLDAHAAVAAYKSLAHVERALRSMKTVDLDVRPDFHYTEQRVRAQVFPRMLAYHVDWHRRERLKPMLFDDGYPTEASATRASPVARAVRSEQAKAADASKRAEEGLPLDSFRTLPRDLATLTCSITHTALNPAAKTTLTTWPTPLQDKAIRLLGLNPARAQYPYPADR